MIVHLHHFGCVHDGQVSSDSAQLAPDNLLATYQHDVVARLRCQDRAGHDFGWPLIGSHHVDRYPRHRTPIRCIRRDLPPRSHDAVAYDDVAPCSIEHLDHRTPAVDTAPSLAGAGPMGKLRYTTPGAGNGPDRTYLHRFRLAPPRA